MISNIEDGEIAWIDLESPTKEEVDSLAKRFELHPLVASELLKPTLHAKIDVYGNFFYLVLYFPFFDEVSRASRSREIDFVVGKNFILTAHNETIEPLRELAKEAKIHGADFGNKKNSGHLFLGLLRTLYSFSLRELDHVHEKIDGAENKIFNGKEKEMVATLSFLRRDLLSFRRALHMHHNIFEPLEKISNAFFGADLAPYIHSTKEEYDKVWNLLENNRETVEALQETNHALLATKTNEIMKVLTILSSLALPLLLIASVFSMNAQKMPIVGRTDGFWIVISIMSASILTMLIFFKIKKLI